MTSVHRECFQFRRCDTTAVQCGLETVLVSFVLSTRTPGTMMELSVEDLLRNSCHPYELHVHTNGVVHSAEVPLFD